jgi:SCP-2 sterol transfer family
MQDAPRGRMQMQIENANQFFGALAARGRDARLGDSTGTWQFDVDGIGTWTVKVDHGAFSVAQGQPPEPPTSLVQLSEAELVHLANGESHENPLTGLLRGAIHVGGDVPFAQRLMAILPLPDDWKEAR